MGKNQNEKIELVEFASLLSSEEFDHIRRQTFSILLRYIKHKNGFKTYREVAKAFNTDFARITKFRKCSQNVSIDWFLKAFTLVIPMFQIQLEHGELLDSILGMQIKLGHDYERRQTLESKKELEEYKSLINGIKSSLEKAGL